MFGFLALIANANSISRRIASDREGLSFCCAAQLSMWALNAGGSRSANTGFPQFVGGHVFFVIRELTFALFCIT